MTERRTGADALPGWRETPAKQAVLDFVHAAGGLGALTELVKLTHSGASTDEFAAVCRRWLASARHPRSGRPYPAMVYQPDTDQILAAAAENRWTVIDMAADWSAVYPPPP